MGSEKKKTTEHHPDDRDECPRCWEHNSRIIKKSQTKETRVCQGCKKEWTIKLKEKPQ